ncbi:MAG: hypothetical protein ACTSVV_15130 [Promethearchaeota archaeon]
MPLSPRHIEDFLADETNDKLNTELLDLLIKRINQLCFEECQIDRITCTMSPSCSRRFLLKLRIKNGLPREDLPLFCYDIQKKTIMRDFRGKSVIYKPFDAYLYLIDFLDIFFHGDYRKLNKFLTFKEFDKALKIFDDRRENRNENFIYIFTDNYIVFDYENRIHVIFLEKNYVLCNALRDSIESLELLKAICDLHAKPFFPNIKVNLIPGDSVELSMTIPNKIVLSIEEDKFFHGENKSHSYFWNEFADDLYNITDFCKEINLYFDKNANLKIKLYISLLTNLISRNKKRLKIRFRNLKIIFDFFNRLIEEF